MGFIDFLYFGGIGVIFCIVQFLALLKIKKNCIKWLPIGIPTAGFIFCFVLYLNLFWTKSLSVLTENQYFSLFLLIPIIFSFIGSLFGYISYKLFNRFH